MPVTDYHEAFAAVYDVFYAARDIGGEVRLSAELLGLADGTNGTRHVLDFGCGTGAHVLAFAARNIRATGFDRSEAMITAARAKPRPEAMAEVCFEAGSLRAFCNRSNGRRFDGAVSFFNVLNCIETPGEMVSQLCLIRSQLAPGAALLVDVWNGAAVFVDQPRPDIRHYDHPTEPDCELVRITLPRLDRINQCCTLHYRVLTLNRGTGGFTEFESIHQLRFLTPVQYRHVFELAGLSIADEFPKGKPGTPVTEGDWYMSYLLHHDA